MTATISRPAKCAPMPGDPASGGTNDSQRAKRETTPTAPAPAGADSRPATANSTTIPPTPGGLNLAGRHEVTDTRTNAVASDQPSDRRVSIDAHTGRAVGSNAGQGQVAAEDAKPAGHSLLDPALALAADVLDDIERVRTANENRLRQLTRSVEDSDGEMRGFGLDESHPDVARLAALVAALEKVEHDATLQLQRQMRRHPLYGWVKAQRGIGDKQAARLLAAVGDPYIRPELVREDGSVVPEGPRTVSALWAYCGLHVLPVGRAALDTQSTDAVRSGGDPGHRVLVAHATSAGVAPKRQRGQKANWSTNAKTRAYLIATSCLKQLVKPCTGSEHLEDCACSPYRTVYDRRRAHTAVTRPDWTDGHSHNDALRVASKAILRDLWREAKRIHEARATT